MTIAEILTKLYPNLKFKVVHGGDCILHPIGPKAFYLQPQKTTKQEPKECQEFHIYAETEDDVAITIAISKPYKIHNPDEGGAYAGAEIDYFKNKPFTEVP